jgi:hypothetical protein
MGKPEKLTGRERVARRRAALRADGLRPKQFWVPDICSEEFRAQIRREVEAINRSDSEADDQAFIDSLLDWDDLPPYDPPPD